MKKIIILVLLLGLTGCLSVQQSATSFGPIIQTNTASEDFYNCQLDKQCFIKHLKNCEQAIFNLQKNNTKVQITETDTIEGVEADKCLVSIEYIKFYLPQYDYDVQDMTDKKMYCYVPISQQTDDYRSYFDYKNCFGPLVEVIKANSCLNTIVSQGLESGEACYSQQVKMAQSQSACQSTDSACLKASSSQTQVAENTAVKDASECAALKNNLAKTRCYYSIIKQNLNYSLCSKMPYNEDAENCLTFVAAVKKDSYFCQQITTLKKRVDCLQTLEAVREGAAGCIEENTQENRNTCFLKLASATADTSYCSAIINMAKDPNAKNMCYYLVALNFGDKTLCNKITDSQIKNTCLNSTP